MNLVEIGMPQIPPPAAPPVAAAVRRRASPAAPARVTAPVIDAAEHEVLFGVLAPCLGWGAAAEASEAALRRFGGLAATLQAPECELAALGPLGEAGAATLKGLAAAARHLGALQPAERPALRSLPAIMAHLHAGGAMPPGLRAIFLDSRDQVIAEETMGAAEDGAAARVLRRAVVLNAVAVILLRHAPEGDPTALAADMRFARRIAELARVIELEVRDFVVIGAGAPASLRGLGLLA